MSTQRANDSTTQPRCAWPGRPGMPPEQQLIGLAKPKKMSTKIIEDGPVNRSVAILPSLGLIPPPRLGLPGKPTMGLPGKPMIGLPTKPTMGLPTKPTTGLVSKTRQDSQDILFDPQNEDRGAKPSNWKVSDSSISCVPEHHFLERTHRFISHTSATVVSTRISDYLRDCSIEAKYDDNKAKAICKNKSMDKYRITLFRGRGEYEHGVIVEVQRRSGSSVSFMRDCRAILDAADGELFDDKPSCEVPPIPEALKSVDIPISMPDSTTVAAGLLKKHDSESKILGTEILCFGTDCTKTDPKTALATTKSIFDEKSSIFQEIINIIETPKFEQNEDCSYEKLYFLNLQLFYNLVNVAKEGSILVDIVYKYRWFTEKLVPLLINVIRNCPSRIQDATVAAKTLNCLASASDEMRNMAKRLDVSSMYMDVSHYASCHHADFAQECLEFKTLFSPQPLNI
mmetsp:Transcript_12405/g.15511  ORF Transcript_12405/g.15511 Transcript_12405/m.15511 type:complete len:455 (+) Transcript_12405:132-1496(+)|eukprot:CAMPEP_0172495060 /NCGR_PEP_ID=MMETSP1066-20121228/63027_1 /TAXON_ID=671091 /ORGANISM="Coscinodiscus wailesii, Strain CCMP2513" /LENGTH=454 /DNA_ID=CAMNT_0013266507 /DNA_START=133 /DNA_END=1497 /DNA_ORIENTATION=+